MTQTALITGASRGLGFALAHALAERGWNLVVNARTASDLETVRADLAQLTNIAAIPGDVSDARHVESLIEAAGAFGGLDALVNNAGILGPSSARAEADWEPQPDLLSYPLAELERVYRINTLAPLQLIQLAAPVLKPGARVLNISSDAAVEGYAGWGGYGSSKAALEAITRVLAVEHPEWRVYSLDPGDMNTRMHQEAFPGEDISDRPSPEASLPGILRLLQGDLPSGRYRAQAMLEPGKRELRFILTVDGFEAARDFYRDAFQLTPQKAWDDPDGRGVVFEVPHALLEILDRADADKVDRLETGEARGTSFRMALEVDGLDLQAERLQQLGAKTVSQPVQTPWGHLGRRLETPDGRALTVFTRVEP
jgi:NAD(P)-dependent dehydrogenase (short-subunit alcohol dehydrogenase family)